MKYEMTKTIANNIKRYRTLHHLTQEQLAEKLSLDSQYYSQLERGERKFSIEKICTLCKLFDIDVNMIIELPAKDTAPQEAAKEAIDNISSELPKLNLTQLQILYKYITEILPLQK